MRLTEQQIQELSNKEEQRLLRRIENPFDVQEGKSTLSLHVPYDLKYLFKKAFKNAKWNDLSERWSVTYLEYEKIKKWTELNTEAAIECYKSEYHSKISKILGKEYDELMSDIRRFKEDINNLNSEYSDKVKNLKTLIEVAKIERENLIKERKEAITYYSETCKPLVAAQKEVRESREELSKEHRKIFEAIVDIDEINDALSIMEKNKGYIKRKNREEWEDGKEVLLKAFKKLRAAGWHSEGLDKITDVQWRNSTDMSDVDYDDFFKLSEYKEEEEDDE